MSETNWELKDRRIAWQSITKSLCEVQAALINSKMVKFDSLKDAMEDIHKSRDIEMSDFLNIDVLIQTTTTNEKTQGSSDGGEEKRYVCEKCDAKITEGVSNWSLSNYGRALCMKCQGKEK